jgi:hypothetical protein
VEELSYDEAAMKRRRAMLRVFQLMRDEDVSGVSGVGRVAVGVIFPSGKVVLEWLGSDTTLGIYDRLDQVERIHGHQGKTRIVSVDNVSLARNTRSRTNINGSKNSADRR